MAVAALAVKYRDVMYMMPWLIQIGLYASPVAYALSAVPDDLLPLYNANPVTWLLEGFRCVAARHACPTLVAVAGGARGVSGRSPAPAWSSSSATNARSPT